MPRIINAGRLPIIAALILATALLAGCNPFSWLTDANTSQSILGALGGDTRIEYTIKARGAAPIVNARMEFFALMTGGDPTQADDYETVADAVLTTDEEGKALLTFMASPNEAQDSVVRPETLYRMRVTAAGFQELVTTETPRSEAMGLKDKTLELQPAS